MGNSKPLQPRALVFHYHLVGLFLCPQDMTTGARSQEVAWHQSPLPWGRCVLVLSLTAASPGLMPAGRGWGTIKHPALLCFLNAPKQRPRGAECLVGRHGCPSPTWVETSLRFGCRQLKQLFPEPMACLWVWVAPLGPFPILVLHPMVLQTVTTTLYPVKWCGETQHHLC